MKIYFGVLETIKCVSCVVSRAAVFDYDKRRLLFIIQLFSPVSMNVVMPCCRMIVVMLVQRADHRGLVSFLFSASFCIMGEKAA